MRSSAEIFAEFPDSINTPELNIELEEDENFIFMERMFAEANFTEGKITTIDGMRVDFSNGWGLVRASNTTPSLVIRFGADSKEALLGIQESIQTANEENQTRYCVTFLSASLTLTQLFQSNL